MPGRGPLAAGGGECVLHEAHSASLGARLLLQEASQSQASCSEGGGARGVGPGAGLGTHVPKPLLGAPVSPDLSPAVSMPFTHRPVQAGDGGRNDQSGEDLASG